MTSRTEQSHRKRSVLFVCTANICRSPMAEVLFRARLRKLRNDWPAWQVESAGTWAADGIPASKRSVQVMAEYGLDITGHRSRVVTREMLEEFDLILTMEPGHKEGMGVEFPEAAQRIFLLSEMEGAAMPVADPYGGTLEDYQKAAGIIDEILANGMERILAYVDQMHS